MELRLEPLVRVFMKRIASPSGPSQSEADADAERQ
jgi:hypothetical protein